MPKIAQTLKDRVTSVYRAKYLRLKNDVDAHNETLREVAGPYDPKASKQKKNVRNEVILLLRNVRPTDAMRRKAGTGTITLKVHTLDVWGNKKDGWEINDVYPSRGEVSIPKDFSKDDIFAALKRGGFIGRGVRHKSVRIDDDIVYDREDKPAYQLRSKSGKAWWEGDD